MRMRHPHLLLLAALLGLTACSSIKVAKTPWNPGEARVSEAVRPGAAEFIRYFRAQKPDYDTDRDPSYYPYRLERKFEDSSMRGWGLALKPKQDEISLSFSEWDSRLGRSEGTLASDKLSNGRWDRHRQAWVWGHGYGKIVWYSTGDIYIGWDDFNKWGLFFHPDGTFEHAESTLGIPVHHFFRVTEVVSVKPASAYSKMVTIQAKLACGATYHGDAELYGSSLTPYGFGRLSWPDGRYVMAKWIGRKPDLGVYHDPSRPNRYSYIYLGFLRSPSEAGESMGEKAGSLVRFKDGEVLFRTTEGYEMVVHADGSFSKRYIDRSDEIRAEADAEAAKRKAQEAENAEYLRLNPSARSGTFKFMPDKAPDTTCPRCHGTGFCYEWADVRQDTVWDSTRGWVKGTVHTSAGIITCPRCSGTGRR